MKLLKNILILVLILLAVSVAYETFFVSNAPLTYFSPQSASSTVYVENGVSGVVSITDPSTHRTVRLNIIYDYLERGSGAIVSKNGYIITAFHVIGDPNANNQNELRKMTDNDIKFYVEEAAVSIYLSHYNPQLSTELLNNNHVAIPSDLNGTINATTHLLIQNNLISANSYHQIITVKFPASDGIGPLNAQLVDVGDSEIHDDVALLKVNPSKNLPALNISSQNQTTRDFFLQLLGLGENIRIYGYPGSSNVTQTQLSVTPSTAGGSIKAKEPNSQNTIYYRTNASIFPGYSGGPVLNSKNELIGILIYGIDSRRNLDQQTESQSSLFLSSNYIIQICKKNNVPITVV